jgi:hypothetical protein
MTHNDTIRIQDRDVPVERTRLTVSQLTLDPENPRIQYLIGRLPGDVSQQDLDDLLWSKDPVKALAQSIKQNGGVYENLIVQEFDGRFVVREGNSRTVAARHLAATHPGDDRFTTVPVTLFDGEITEDDLAVLLADMHVTGKIRWDAYEQAKHVWTLHNIHGKPYEWLATHLRMSKSKITQQLKAYKWTTEYLTENHDPRNIEKFAFFYELARKRQLDERYTDDPDFQHQFKTWLSEGKLNDSKQVRQLGTVLSNHQATKVLDEDGWNAATNVLIREDPALGSDLYVAVKRATEALQKVPFDEITDLGNNKQKLLMLRNLNRAIQDLATHADVEL